MRPWNVSKGYVRGERRVCSVAEKRQIVELSLQPGMSVARTAQTVGVNANRVFKWRQDCRSGLLLGAGGAATSLIPV